MPKPTATAAKDRMMHLRSSSRCCNRLMEPICRTSFSSSCGCSGSATRSGIEIPRDCILHAIGQAIKSALDGKIFVTGKLGDLRRKMLAGIGLFQVHLADLFMNLALELLAGSFEFRHDLANGAGNLRQLPRPKQDEGQEHNEDDLAGKAKVHDSVRILPKFLGRRDQVFQPRKNAAPMQGRNAS